MSAFTDAENWYEDAGHRQFCTVAPLPWEIGRVGSGLWLTVPEGTYFDVSVPRCLHWLLSPLDRRYLKAAALHDFALGSGWDRVSAAAAFSEALRADGVGKWKRITMVIAVIIWHWQ